MLQFMGSQRVGHDLVTKQQQQNKYVLENSLPGGSDGKESACNTGDKGDADLILESGRSAGRRKWQFVPILLPEKSHGQRR